MGSHKQRRVPARLLLNPVHFLALGLGSGLAPKMPGTIGTAMGAILYFFLLPTTDWRTYLIVILIGFIAGIFICAYTTRELKMHDHSSIVWDEIVGYWITMFLVPRTLIWVVIGFILFRLFDIYKPWPISLADKKLKGGFGIMLDDVIAALASLFIIQIIIYLL